MRKGKLVRVELSPGRFVKMHEADAIAQGHIPNPKAKSKAEEGKSDEGDQQKMRRPAGDKMRRPEGDKAETVSDSQPTEPEQEAPQADFETIPGVGPATARALVAHGIKTFEDLATAEDLDFLPGQVLESIAEWRMTPHDDAEEEQAE